MRINVTRSSMPDFEEFCQEIRPLWDSHWLTNNGEKLLELQSRLEAYLDVGHLSLFTNGHLALEALLEALDLRGEVITTPFTFASTTHALVRKGLTPVFCDIRESDYTLDPELLEGLITERTCAILPVHVYGCLCDADAIQTIADRHGLKVYHTIEGGAVATESAELYDRLALVRNFGITGPDDVVSVGGNAKMNEFQAAMGLCNLRHVDDEIALRRHVHDRYMDRLDGVRGLRLPPTQPGVRSNYAYFPVVFAGGRTVRDAVCEALDREGVYARKYFYPLVTDFECYRGRAGFDTSRVPVARRISDGVVTLPLYPELSDAQVDLICRVVREVLRHA